jgi:hypothetical protein
MGKDKLVYNTDGNLVPASGKVASAEVESDILAEQEAAQEAREKHADEQAEEARIALAKAAADNAPQGTEVDPTLGADGRLADPGRAIVAEDAEAIAANAGSTIQSTPEEKATSSEAVEQPAAGKEAPPVAAATKQQPAAAKKPNAAARPTPAARTKPAAK